MVTLGSRCVRFFPCVTGCVLRFSARILFQATTMCVGRATARNVRLGMASAITPPLCQPPLQPRLRDNSNFQTTVAVPLRRPPHHLANPPQSIIIKTSPSSSVCAAKIYEKKRSRTSVCCLRHGSFSCPVEICPIPPTPSDSSVSRLLPPTNSHGQDMLARPPPCPPHISGRAAHPGVSLACLSVIRTAALSLNCFSLLLATLRLTPFPSDTVSVSLLIFIEHTDHYEFSCLSTLRFSFVDVFTY